MAEQPTNLKTRIKFARVRSPPKGSQVTLSEVHLMQGLSMEASPTPGGSQQTSFRI